VAELPNPTHRLLSNYERSVQRVKDLRDDLNRAECELANNTNALGARLVPEGAGAKDGERVGFWQRNEAGYERFIWATRIRPGDYKIVIVQKPDEPKPFSAMGVASALRTTAIDSAVGTDA
jgi:hypothetical protein